MSLAEPQAIASSGHRSGTRECAAVVVLYCCITAVLTFPWVFHLRDKLPYGSVDLWQNYWNFWWWHKSLLELGQSPYWTQFLYYPEGASLALHTHSPLNMLLGLAVCHFWGVAAAYNVCQLVGFPLAGLGTFCLCKYLGARTGPSFVAGMIYAFFPHHVEQTSEHLNLASIQFFPFLVLFLLKTCRERTIRSAVATGLSASALVLVSWHYGLFGVVLALMVVGYELPRLPRAECARVLGLLGLSAAIALVVTAPFAFPLVKALGQEGAIYIKASERRGIDPVFLLLPPDSHPLLGRLTEAYYAAHRLYPDAGFLCYTGWVPLALAVLGAIRWNSSTDRWFWICVALFFLVLALGDYLIVGGRVAIAVRLPHAWLSKMPILNVLRIANRFVVVFMLAVAVLASQGLDRVVRSTRLDRVAVAAAILIGFEFLWVPFPLQSVTVDPVLASLRSRPDPGAVLNIPLGSGSPYVLAMVAQTQHELPIAGGYVSVSPGASQAALEKDAVLSQLFGMTPQVPEELDLQHLRSMGFRYVLMHKGRIQETVERLREVPGLSHYERKSLRVHRAMPLETWHRIQRCLEQSGAKVIHDDEQYRVLEL